MDEWKPWWGLYVNVGIFVIVVIVIAVAYAVSHFVPSK